MVGTFALLELLCRIILCEGVMFLLYLLNLFLHLGDLCVCQFLYAETIMFAKVVFDELGLSARVGNEITIHYLIAVELQEVQCTLLIIALFVRCLQPLLYLLGKIVVNSHSLLFIPVKNRMFLSYCDKRRYILPIVEPVVTKSSKTIMLGSWGSMFRVYSALIRCLFLQKATSS